MDGSDRSVVEDYLSAQNIQKYLEPPQRNIKQATNCAKL
jgi:hypothetical protein